MCNAKLDLQWKTVSESPLITDSIRLAWITRSLRKRLGTGTRTQIKGCDLSSVQNRHILHSATESYLYRILFK